MTDQTPPTIEGDDRVRKCSASNCGASIIFLPTSSGRSMPINADTVDKEDEIYTHGKHVSHFATCPAHEKFRRGGSHQ